jgi:hypothetical protein
MFFNLLTLRVPGVTPGCFSIFWLWAYLTLLQDVFQSFDFERTWRYSRMFLNLLRQVRSKSIDWKTSWSNVRYAQSQQIEKHPRVTSGTLKGRIFFNRLTLSVPDVTPGCLTLHQEVFQSFDFELTWRYSRMFFNLLTLNVPDVTPGVTSGTLNVKRLKNILE